MQHMERNTADSEIQSKVRGKERHEVASCSISLSPSISPPQPTKKSSNTNDQAGKGEIRDRLCGYEGENTARVATKCLAGLGASCYSIPAEMPTDLHAM